MKLHARCPLHLRGSTRGVSPHKLPKTVRFLMKFKQILSASRPVQFCNLWPPCDFVFFIIGFLGDSWEIHFVRGIPGSSVFFIISSLAMLKRFVLLMGCLEAPVLRIFSSSGIPCFCIGYLFGAFSHQVHQVQTAKIVNAAAKHTTATKHLVHEVPNI